MKKATCLNNFYSVYIRNVIAYNKRCDDFLIWMYTDGNKQQEKIDMKKEYTNKQRKVWKLKRKNVVLGQWREQLLQKGLNNSTLRTYPDREPEMLSCLDIFDIYRISALSFEIGKNSNKIQRLRTLIQQEKLK